MSTWSSGRLAQLHDLSQFDCGVTALNQWLCGQARDAQVRGTAATYVWTAADTSRVVAYYAIAPHQVRREQVSSAMAGDSTVIPAYLLARLALDVTLHGQGLGAELLHDAMDRIVTAAETASGRLIVVDAIDATAAAFYRHHDFSRYATTPAASSSQSAQSARHSAADTTPPFRVAYGRIGTSAAMSSVRLMQVRPGRIGWMAAGLVDLWRERRPTMPRWRARPRPQHRGGSAHVRSTAGGRERRRSRPRPRRSRTPRSGKQDSSLLLHRQIVPAYQADNLSDLVAHGLPALDLKVDEFGHTWVREHSVAAPAADLPEAQRQHEADQVVEAHVGDVSASDSGKKKVGLHTRGRYGGGTTKCSFIKRCTHLTRPCRSAMIWARHGCVGEIKS